MDPSLACEATQSLKRRSHPKQQPHQAVRCRREARPHDITSPSPTRRLRFWGNLAVDAAERVRCPCRARTRRRDQRTGATTWPLPMRRPYQQMSRRRGVVRAPGGRRGADRGRMYAESTQQTSTSESRANLWLTPEAAAATLHDREIRHPPPGSDEAAAGDPHAMVAQHRLRD